MLKATTLRLEEKVYNDLTKIAKNEYLDISAFLRQLVMKAYSEYKLELSLKDFANGKKSIGDVAEENNISIWEAMDDLKKRNISSAVTLEDMGKDIDFDL
ncbi:MAG: hypothetical protein V1824_04370 [archaeon]